MNYISGSCRVDCELNFRIYINFKFANKSQKKAANNCVRGRKKSKHFKSKGIP